MSKEKRIPTTQRLAEALRAANAPESMIRAAEDGAYDDFKSSSAAPILNLVHQALAAGLPEIAKRAKAGEFGAPRWEADEWAQSPDGQATFQEFFQAAPTKFSRKKHH